MCWMRSSPAACSRGAIAHAVRNNAHPAASHALVFSACIAGPLSCCPIESFSQDHIAAHHTRARMARRDLHGVTRLAAHDPFAFEAIVGHDVIGPERHTGVL